MQSGHHNGHDRVLDADYTKMSLNERLAYLVEGRKNPVFTTSLGIEDQVLTAALSVAAPRVRIVTLETGRLFEETMALIDETQERYGITIERFRPDEAQLAEYAAQYGMNGFYESVAARHACCGVRKLEPLARALSGADLWITGLRCMRAATLPSDVSPARGPSSRAKTNGPDAGGGKTTNNANADCMLPGKAISLPCRRLQ